MKVSTKNLVILGFALVLMIMGGMAISGYVTSSKSTAGLAEFKGYLEQSNLVNDMVDDFADTTTQMLLFKQNPGDFNPKEVGADSTPDYYARAQKSLQSSAQNVTKVVNLLHNDPANIGPSLKTLQTSLTQYDEISQKIYNDLKGLRLTLANDISPQGAEIERIYKELDAFAISIENTRLSSRGGQIFANYLGVRNMINRAIDRIDPAASTDITNELKGIHANFVQLRLEATTPRGRDLITSIISALEDFTTYTQNAFTTVSALDGRFKQNLALDNSISALTKTLLASVNTEMDNVADNVDVLNASGFKISVGFGIVGIISGILIAIFIIMRLVSTLTRITNYAKDIAEGNFATTLDINEPGEMGAVATSLRSIPSVLNQTVTEFRDVATAVSHGKLDTIGDADAYEGSFRSIIEGTNDIMSRFRSIIDEIPSTIVMLDPSLRLTYMNPAGRALAGQDYQGKFCKDVFAREDDSTSTCALTLAASTLKRHSAETKAHPQGAELEITYTAIPLLDETGKLAAIFQFITDLTDVKQTQNMIVRAVRQATEIADRVAAASEELAVQMQHVNEGAEMQRDRVSSTATAMEEMNATVLDVARNAGQASEQTDAARDKAHDGANIVAEVVDSINRLNTITEGMHTDMSELGKKAEEVGSVMSVIADIADQTNLLALNAAIEAARAGEAGRGFAVVADEVRKLAENTMSATSEVGAVIQAIQQATTKNINNVNTAAENMATATEQTNHAGTALNEIVDLVNESALLISGIATASEQQSATSEEINQSVDEINRIVGETSESVVQSSAAVDDLARIAVELKQVLDSLQA